jgi:hypothetical protein
MNTKLLRIAFAGLTAAIPMVGVADDQPIQTVPLIQPSFDHLIPTGYPVIVPNYAKLKTADSAQLIHPGFGRLIATTYPLIQPAASRLKVTTNPVNTPALRTEPKPAR